MTNRLVAAIVVVAVIIGAIGGYYHVNSGGSVQMTQTQSSVLQSATLGQYTSSTQTSGGQVTITVSGAFALYPLVVTWGQQYQSANPNVQVQVSAGGAGKGMTDVLGGLVDIGMVSRSIAPTELQQGAYPIDVAKGAVVAIINVNNPVLTQILSNGIMKSKLKGIFVDGNVTEWGQAIDQPFTPVNKIDVYTRSDSAGTASNWAKFLSRHATQWDLQGIGVYGDPGVIQAVQSDPLGIGYCNFNFAYDNTTGKPISGITVVPIDLNNAGSLNATENFYGTRQDLSNAIASDAYPASTDLYLVTKGKPTGATQAFLIWILTDGQKYVTQNGLVQLPQATVTQELAQIQS
jgi:phosphate transport system substrate-binding protein